MIQYRGTDERGAGVSGSLSSNRELGNFVQARFRRGWKRLTVTRAGEVIGEIWRAGSRDGHSVRSWWSE